MDKVHLFALYCFRLIVVTRGKEKETSCMVWIPRLSGRCFAASVCKISNCTHGMADNYVATRRVLFFFSQKVQRDVSPVCETRSRLLLRSRRGRSPPMQTTTLFFFFFPSPANGVIVSVRRRLWLALIRVTWPARRRHVVAAAIWMSFLNPAVSSFSACFFFNVLSRFLVCLFVWWLTIYVVLCSLPSFFY